MKLTAEQIEKLRKISASCGNDLVAFFNAMIMEISDIRTDLQVDPKIEKELRLAVIELFKEFTDNIKRLSDQKQIIAEDRFD